MDWQIPFAHGITERQIEALTAESDREKDIITEGEYIHTYIYTHIHIYTYTFIQTFIRSTYLSYSYIHTYIYTYIHPTSHYGTLVISYFIN